MAESTKTKNRPYPSAVYAAAGVGDLAYEQLRKLPELADRLRGKAGELAGRAASLRDQADHAAPEWRARANEYGARATGKAADLTARIDPDRIRDSIVTGTQGAAEKAAAFYEELVARGERSFEPSGTGTAKQAAPSKTHVAPKKHAEPRTHTETKPHAGTKAGTKAGTPAAKKATKRQPRTK